MTKKSLTETMERLYSLRASHGDDSYQELWDSVNVLVNLGLLDESLKAAMWKKDRELWEGK